MGVQSVAVKLVGAPPVVVDGDVCRGSVVDGQLKHLIGVTIRSSKRGRLHFVTIASSQTIGKRRSNNSENYFHPTDVDAASHPRHHTRIRIRTRSEGLPMRLYKATYTKLDPATGKRILRKTAKWYCRIPGQRVGVPLCTNKKAAQEMAARLLLEHEQEKAVPDPTRRHARQPLAVHLADFRAHLQAKGAGPKHVGGVCHRVEAIISGTRAVYPADLSGSKIELWLSEFAGAAPPVEIPAGIEQFRHREVAALLGVKPSAVNAIVRRRRLPANGKGRARRYPRSTVEAILADRARGRGPETRNHYLRAIKQFCRWLVRDRRIATSPVAALELVDLAGDVRRDRRALTADELRQVIEAARTSDWVFRGLAGSDRATLYHVAAATGYRAEELSRLTPANFDLAGPHPVAWLPSADTKNRRSAEQPLPADLVEELTRYLAGKSANQPVWPGSWYTRAAEMLRHDLECARIAYKAPGREGDQYADFHSLRHSYVALLESAGATLKEAMQLARHSDPRLTLKRYGRAQLSDLAARVEKMPVLSPACAHPAQAIDTNNERKSRA